MKDNKNTILLTIIALSTIMISIIGITYAYFTGSIDNSGTINATATIEGGNLVFDCSGGTLSLDISSSSMDESLNNTLAGSESGNVVCNISGMTGMSCSYSLYYSWSSGTYSLTTSGAKELTLEVSGQQTISEFQVVDSTSTGAQTLGNTQSIVVGANNSSSSQTHTITARFYNLPVIQNHKGKTLELKVGVTNVIC